MKRNAMCDNANNSGFLKFKSRHMNVNSKKKNLCTQTHISKGNTVK